MHAKDIERSHPIFSAEAEVRKIRKQLSNYLPISYSDYQRYSFDGKHIGVAEKPECVYNICKMDLLPNENDLAKNNAHCVLLSASLPAPESLRSIDKLKNNLEISRAFDIEHRLLLAFQTVDYLEIFSFGIGKNINPFDVFFNNIHMLELYCIYFREQSTQLIKEVEKYPLIYSSTLNDNSLKNISLIEKMDFPELIEMFELKKMKFKEGKRDFTLSNRELECLIWTLKNRSAKQIAKNLKLSYRTVEDYLNNIKSKFSCNTKEELKELSLKNPVIKYIVEN